ncbi:MAG: S8 family serine peptidase [Clostridia bacterium]|nr:S8 family serine peptidase [Clostridia bacterium]
MNKLKTIIARMVMIALVIGLLAPVVLVGAAKSDFNQEKRDILVKYKDDKKGELVKSSLKKKLKLKDIKSKRKLQKGKIELIEVDDAANIASVVTELKKDSNVLYAQPDYKLFMSYSPEEPKFSEQWGLSNKMENGIDINTVKAWELTKGNADVIIGVLDTGIDIDHEDLAGNIFRNQLEIPGNGKDDDKNGYIDDIAGWDFASEDPMVFDSGIYDIHGTHIAGIIAASENKTGIMGTAPNVKILPLKFINGNYGYTSDAIEAIEYAKSLGVKIINCSWGGPDENIALKEEIKNNSDILFVCAAGNNGNTAPLYPASFDLPNVISVAALDREGKLAATSNYGSKVQVAAPGVNILSTIPGNNYGTLSGTSMAAPFVSGIAGLLKSTDYKLTPEEITRRIKNCSIANKNLSGKVLSGGVVSAYAALKNDTSQKEEEEEKQEEEQPKPTSLPSEVTSMAENQPLLAEQIHFGKEGVYPPTGNFSDTYIDLAGVFTPGFDIKISRTYNSRDGGTNALFGRGWAFNYYGRIEYQNGDSVLTAKISGGTYAFLKDATGAYNPYMNRGKMEKKSDGTCILTTKDQMQYGFNNQGSLGWMKDKFGNTLNFSVSSSSMNGYMIYGITDNFGRTITISYNAQNLIDTITDPLGRKVKYEYENGVLAKVTNPMGNKTFYKYGPNNGYLTEIRNDNNELINKIEYDSYNSCVSKITDAVFNTYSFTYDGANKKTTVIDSNQCKYIYEYNDERFITKITDPEDKITTKTYTSFGEEEMVTDRNGNITEYLRGINGNIIRITNPDKSVKTFEYDDKNNLIKERDEKGVTTYYIYSADKVFLEKKVQPLNGIDAYAAGQDESKFAVTSYTYNRNGQVLTEKDPEGNITTYEYDANANLKSVRDPDGSTTLVECNKLGWTTKVVSPKGHKTEKVYDDNGALIKVVLHNGETTRYVYNPAGRKVREISANLYDPSHENTANKSYMGGEGATVTYYPSGLIRSATDAENYVKSYTYDLYGNVETETKPDGSIIKNEYDKMQRLWKVYSIPRLHSDPVLLKEYSYEILTGGKTKKTEKVYLNDKETAETAYIYDSRGQLIEKTNPDGSKVINSYYTNGQLASTTDENGFTAYYKYDGLGRLTEQWNPFEAANGTVYYTYSATEYDKTGKVIVKRTSADKALSFGIPKNLISTYYTYYPDGKVKCEYTGTGKRIDYEYDEDGAVTKETVLKSDSEKIIREYENNHLGKKVKMKEYVDKKDLAGNDVNVEGLETLITEYAYDKEGNVVSVINTNGAATEYVYDKLGRQVITKAEEINEFGDTVTDTVSTTLDFEGKKLTSTDTNGHATKYVYNAMGLLEKVIDANNGITAYFYDRAGRRIAEVSPKNYIQGKPITEMNRVEYTYDPMGRVLTKNDIYKDPASGKMVKVISKAFKYDKKGNVIKELDALGFDFGNGDTVEKIIDSGYGTEYTYNAAGLKCTVLDPVSKDRGLAVTNKAEYDAMGRKIAEMNAAGVKEIYEYDSDGNVVFQKHQKPDNGPTVTLKALTFDLLGNVLTSKDALGNTTTYEYNLLNKARKMKTPGDNTIPSLEVTYQYDKMGRLVKESDTLGKVKIHRYNHKNLETSITEEKADGSQSITVSTVYDGNGNKISEKDGNGNVKEKRYDPLNRLVYEKITVTDLNGKKKAKVTKYAYDKNGNQTMVTDWKGNKLTQMYDPLNRLVKKTDQNGKDIEKLEYNINNAQVKSYDVFGNATTFEYDKNNRLLKTTDPLGHYKSQSYDNVGNTAFKTDGNGRTTQYAYDDFNQLLQVKNAKDEVTRYAYDLNGNMLSQTDAKGNTTRYEYNAANKVTRKIGHGGKSGSSYVASKVQSYTYDAYGNVAAMTDRNGDKTTCFYDVHGRLLKKEAEKVFEVNNLEDQDGKLSLKNSEVTFVEYTYDDNGNQLTMTDSTGTTERTYDEENRVVAKTVPNFGTSKFLYDVTNGVPQGYYGEVSTDPKGNSTTKVYDKVGRIHSVKANEKTTTYAYYDNGSRKSVVYPDGSKGVYTYFDNNLIESLTNYKNENGKPVIMDTYKYQYDNANNQISKTEVINGKAKGLTSYTYDVLNRLESVKEPNGRLTVYAFDKAGNRITETVTLDGTTTVTSYSYDSQNRLLSTLTKVNGAETEAVKYTYDPNGNMISKSVAALNANATGDSSVSASISGTDNSSVSHYEYDGFNQLVKVEAGGKTQYYAYNGDGLRVEKVIGDKTTRYLYEYDKVVLEVDGTGKQLARNVYGTNLLSRTMDGQTLYYMYNGHGDVTALINELPEENLALGKEVTTKNSVIYNPKHTTDGSLNTYSYTDLGSGIKHIIIDAGKSEYIDRIKLWHFFGDARTYRDVIVQLSNDPNFAEGVVTVFNNDADNSAGQGAGTDAEYVETAAGKEIKFGAVNARYIRLWTNGSTANGANHYVEVQVFRSKIVGSYYYDAFGNITEAVGTVSNPIRYAGYQYDEETGLYYLNARFYDPKVARFLQEDTYTGDPNDPLSLNLYTYCHNEPMMYTDPTGHADYSLVHEGVNPTEAERYNDEVITTWNLLNEYERITKEYMDVLGTKANYVAKWGKHRSAGQLQNEIKYWDNLANDKQITLASIQYQLCFTGSIQANDKIFQKVVDFTQYEVIMTAETVAGIRNEYRKDATINKIITKEEERLKGEKRARIGSLVLDLLPGVGQIKGLAEMYRGKNLVTGESLNGWDYFFTAVGALGPVSKIVSKTVKGLDKASDLSKAKMGKTEFLSKLDELEANGFIRPRNNPNNIKGTLKIPQGLTREQFANTSKLIRQSVGNISDDIVVQGSRAGGTAKETSDIDYAIRVSSEKFDELIKQRFGTPNSGSAKEKTMLHAIETGKIQAGEAGLRGLRKQLQEMLGIDVDISIIKSGGAFDNGPMINLPK